MLDLSKLYNGQKVKARFARGDVWSNEHGHYIPNYSDWKIVTLYVRRRTPAEAIKNRRQRVQCGYGNVGDIIELTVNDFDWASYTQADYSPEYNEWLAEDYRMEIEIL